MPLLRQIRSCTQPTILFAEGITNVLRVITVHINHLTFFFTPKSISEAFCLFYIFYPKWVLNLIPCSIACHPSKTKLVLLSNSHFLKKPQCNETQLTLCKPNFTLALLVTLLCLRIVPLGRSVRTFHFGFWSQALIHP